MKILSLAIACILMTACATQKNGNLNSENPIEISTDKTIEIQNIKWELTYLKGMNTIPDKNPYFTILDTKINGFAGCNRFFGKAKLNNNNLDLSSLASTRMACRDNNKLEYLFLQSLEKINKTKATETTLQLMLDDTLIMRFQKAND